MQNCLITFMSWSIPPDFLHWASWLESPTQIFVQCPGPWNVSRVEWKPSGLQVPLTNKWSNDQVTTWPSDPMRKKGRWQIWFWSKVSSRALWSQWHLATLTHLEEPLSMRATPMSSSTLSGAANNKEYPINWPVDLREGRSPDVIYFWQVLFLGTSFNKFLVLIDLRLSFHSLRNFELISIFSGFEQQQIWERSKRHPRRPGAQHQHYNFKIDIKGFIALLLFSRT